MADIASTLSVWGTKKRGAKAKASSAASDDGKAAQQRRDANARDRALANPDTPQHVKDKWTAIQALGSRNRQQNLQKSKFTEVIMHDVNFEDVY